MSISKYETDVIRQRIVDKRNFGIILSLFTATFIAATVALFGPEHARSLAFGGFEIGTSAGIAYGVIKLVGATLAD